MTGRHGSDRPRPDATGDDRVEALLAAARDTTAAVDTVTLESTLAAYRVAGAQPAAEPAAPERITRRRRLVRAFAATTVATKVLIGVATAAALGGVGVATVSVVEGGSPRPRPTVVVTPSTTPPSDGGTGSGTESPTGSGTPSTSDSVTPTARTTVTDTASVGASGSESASPSASGATGTTTRSASPRATASPTATSTVGPGAGSPSR